MYYVYCLESIKCDKLYIGKTGNLKKRYKEHNSKRGGEFTSKNGPWKLIFYEAFLSKKDADVAELFYKSGNGREILKNKLKNYIENK